MALCVLTNNKQNNTLPRTMAHDDNNNCVICLESLCSAELPIGTTVPCGHCFHVECFAGWKHSKRGQSQRESLKCPMCNNQTTSFCRIFLDLGAVDDPDDGCSLSSVESAADMGDEEDEEEKDDSAESEEKGKNDEAPSENDTVDVICIDDDDDDDDDEQDTSAGSSSDKPKSSESHNKYRKMAKKLKSRVKMLESERQRLGETHKTLSEQHGRMKLKVQEATGNLVIIQTGMATVQRQVESLSLEITRIRRERNQADSDLQKTEVKIQNLETKMREFKKQHAADVERAHTNSMAEVQTILKQNPKLTEENRRLKQEVLRKKERIQQLEARFLGGSLHKNNTTKTADRDRTEHQNSVKSVHRTSKDTAKLLRDFQDHEDDNVEKLSARAPPERMKGKVYANAARFSRASTKPAARLPTAVSALDAIDQQPCSLQTDKHKRPSLEQARKFTNAPPRKRSKILISSAATARPKKGPQHDIRNMLTRR